MIKRITAFILCILMAVSLFPAAALGDKLANGETVFASVDEAAVYLREQLKERKTSGLTVSFYIDESTYKSNRRAAWDELWTKAKLHTGVGSEGDYLSRQISRTSGAMSSAYVDGRHAAVISCDVIEFITNGEQEAQTTAVVNSALGKLIYDGQSEYEKALAIYDHIVTSVRYANSGSISHTAYNAAVNKKAVCDGYALLIYRMMLDAGLDCRLVYGTTDSGGGHAWNIVRVDGKYYNLDATWESNYYAGTSVNSHDFFLKGSANFPDHNLDAEFNSKEFKDRYPLSKSDYSKPAVQKTVYTPESTVDALSEPVGTAAAGSALDKLVPDFLRDYAEELGILGKDLFSDVMPGEWYFEPVLWAIINGITLGTTDTTFGTGESCTRAQIVTFLYRAAGSPGCTRTSSPFKDVTPEKYYYKAVLWAVENGITAGTSDETFSPHQKCTRAQIVTFLYRAAGCPEVKSRNNPFTDVPQNEYYYEAVLWAVENGITAGTSETTFGPDEVCTREQAVTFLYRAEK